MKRRAFVAALGSLASGLVFPPAARAQQPARLARIGYLGFGTAADSAQRVAALRAGLSDLGLVEGKNIALEFRWAESVERLRELAVELADLNVDLVFATSSTEVEAARKATQSIPIIFATHADPVGSGHVASLARPGGNITGFAVLQTELTAKGLELLKEAAPQANRIGVLWSPAAPSHRAGLQTVELAGPTLGVQVQLEPVQGVEDFEGAFAKMAQSGVGAVFVMATALTVRGRAAPTLLAKFALKHRMPSMFGARDNVAAGGLMSYSPNLDGVTRQAATYIDKILKGAKPADLPVQQATRFELVINMQTAKALDLTIPPGILLRADEVIE
jgi:putative tryptophan/tyrosine transport system substrate-binding protein